MKKKIVLISLLIFALIMSACSTVNEEPESNETPIEDQTLATQQPVIKTLDQAFAEIADELPGFAGLYFDEQGVLHVQVVGASSKDEVKKVLLAVLGKDLLEKGVDEDGGMKGADDIVLLAAKFDAKELATWHAQIMDVLSIKGVVYTDFDERKNRIVVAAEKGSDIAKMKQLIADKRVPLEAVDFVGAEPFLMNHSLRNSVSPRNGGLEIRLNGGGSCTLGFNAIRSGVRGFVTNSHCTNTQGGTENTRYRQLFTTIGFERADPAYSTGFFGFGCPTGRRCRNSDSAFVRYNSSISSQLGRIYRPSFNSGTQINHITGGHRTFRLISEEFFQFSGTFIQKVGRTTGRTGGSISSTCINVNQADGNGNDTGITMNCQNMFSGNSGPGDSGSAVFRRSGSSNARLFGILWGGNGSSSVYSTISSIEGELGSLRTF